MRCKVSVKAGADVIYVPTDYSTIQGAINHAISGDTIFVHGGTYYEHIIVNKSVSLFGEDRDSTIIDGNETGTVISIKASYVSVRGFTVMRSGRGPYNSGIFVNQSSGNDISHNTVTDNNNGIGLYFSPNNEISGNTITKNNNGIGLYFSPNNEISGNTVTDNDNGISLYSSPNNEISGNTVTDNDNGISLYSSANNEISGNTITKNNNGIYLALYSRKNIIYCNNFNNTYQVLSDSENVWDDGNQGNYWSDYTGVDKFSGPYQNETGSDGIGDTPFVIDVNNQDKHPLMGTFSDFEVTLERETCHVTTICNSTMSEFRFEIGPETGNKIIRFNVTGKDTTVGFCRVTIPTELMNYPYILLVDVKEIVPTLLDVSNATCVYLYFTYIHSSHTITIISSKTLSLYNELLDEHVELQTDLYNLNTTYYDCLNNYGILLGNYNQLQERYLELNNSYQDHLSDFSKNVYNIRNLTYVLAATTAILIITTIYLSRRAHASNTNVFEDKNRS